MREYSRLAPEYDSRWSFYVEASTEETLARLRPEAVTSVLDVGCGTGALLERLARRHPEAALAGVDPVAEMLAVARSRLSPDVDLRQGWAEQLPFADDSFDVVTSCNMFHYLREPRAALREMGRVLRVGGQLLVTDWCDDYLACRIVDWYLRLVSPAHVKVYGQRECLRLLAEAGQPQAEIERYKISWRWGLMTASAVQRPAVDGEGGSWNE
ncbi:MAG TPA: class I SAM-dependent methyltransferase [Thermoanaerobaculia bacterium]|nr:class I SAM-dependent methyltransferase [Thermoanaerobaculia bacterium]